MKLNNHGWGLQAMLVCILVLMIALVIIASIANKYFKDLIQPLNEVKTYSVLETEVEKAALKYQKLYYQDLENDVTVTIKTLKREDLLNNIRDIKDNTSCSGYAIIEKTDSKIECKAYIKCSNYQTENYMSELDAR